MSILNTMRMHTQTLTCTHAHMRMPRDTHVHTHTHTHMYVTLSLSAASSVCYSLLQYNVGKKCCLTTKLNVKSVLIITNKFFLIFFRGRIH